MRDVLGTSNCVLMRLKEPYAQQRNEETAQCRLMKRSQRARVYRWMLLFLSAPQIDGR